MKRVLFGLIFCVGWVLSPFTWWNDVFVNIPLSYLLANFLFYLTHLKFKWLVIVSYWFTNVLGLVFMYFGGKSLTFSFKERLKATMILLGAVIIYTLVMMYLDREGKLSPLAEIFQVKPNAE